MFSLINKIKLSKCIKQNNILVSGRLIFNLHKIISLLLHSDLRATLEHKRTKQSMAAAMRAVDRAARSGSRVNLSFEAFELMGFLRRRGGGLVERLPENVNRTHAIALRVASWYARCRQVGGQPRSCPTAEDFATSMLYM